VAEAEIYWVVKPISSVAAEAEAPYRNRPLNFRINLISGMTLCLFYTKEAKLK
jgi:hypothetical protein